MSKREKHGHKTLDTAWAVQFQNKDAINVSSENLNKKCMKLSMNFMRKKKWKMM